MTRIFPMRVALAALVLMLVLPLARPAAAQVEMNLRDADLRSFVEIVSEATGRRFVLDPQVRGTVTVLAPGDMSADELYEVFLAVLELNRLTLVSGAGVDRIVQMTTARELASGPEARDADAAYETRVIKVEHVPLSEIIEVIRPVLPAEAVVTPVPASKLLILSDRGSSPARIAALIARLDVPRELPIDTIRLRNANASEVAQVIAEMDIVPPGSALTVDRRSNALVVRGDARLRDQIRVLAGRLDTQQDNIVSTAIGLNYAEAATMADVVLRSLQDTGDDPTGQARIRIVPEPSTNSLLITAPQERLGDIHKMVQYLDRRPTQVLIEAVIFEMTAEGFSDLSVQWAGILNSAIVGGVQFSLEGRPSLTNLVAAVANDQTPDVGPGGVFGRLPDGTEDSIAGFVSAVAQARSTRLLSTPSILTLNNQEAEIVVAQNVPFVTGAFTSTDGAQPDNPFQTIERQDVGLTLTVTPQINADRTVKMEIAQEVSNLTRDSASAGEITSRRALSTTALVRDGNVIMLGGLLENGSGSARQRVPGLSNLPLVGGLFRGKNASRNQRVLLVLLRPQVVASDKEAKRLTRELASEAKAASLALAPADDGHYPRVSGGTLPFDGVDLNQPFDAGYIDDVAQRRDFPPLPTRLRFGQ